MKTDWRGFYLDGRTARRHAVVVGVTRDGLDITFETGDTRRWAYTDIRQTQGCTSAAFRP